MEENFKLAVVGNVSSVLIYKALGCEVYGVVEVQEAQDQTEKLFMAHKDDENKTAQYAVVFVEEDFYKEFQEDLIEKFTKRPLPAVIPVPSAKSGDDDFATQRLRKIVERAIGSDILG